MACPLFLPVSPLAGTACFEGHCGADPEAAIAPEVLRLCCNPGYARNSCARAAGVEADAFRFLVKTKRHGEAEVAWSIERDHHPVTVGVATVTLAAAHTDPAKPLEWQARTYAAARLNRECLTAPLRP